VFVIDSYSEPSAIFGIYLGQSLSERNPLQDSTLRVGWWPCPKISDKDVNDSKHSRLLRYGFNYYLKKFCDAILGVKVTTGAFTIKLFTCKL
jgi:hypothetical protein